MKLGTQVFVSHTKPEAHLIEPVKNELFWKPRGGGLWTSTLDEAGGDWVRWLTGEGYTLDMDHWGGALWLLEPAEANVYVVHDPQSLRALHARFPQEIPWKGEGPGRELIDLFCDWEAIAREYDAVHVPDPWAHRWSADMAASMFFSICDAESTCWFRWCFEGEPQLLDLSVITEGGET